MPLDIGPLTRIGRLRFQRRNSVAINVLSLIGALIPTSTARWCLARRVPVHRTSRRRVNSWKCRRGKVSHRASDRNGGGHPENYASGATISSRLNGRNYGGPYGPQTALPRGDRKSATASRIRHPDR
jgi:hypothetical protein